MLKKIFLSAGIVSALTSNAGIALAQWNCWQTVPCVELINRIGPVYTVLFIAALILALVLLVFWLVMFFHAVTHPVNHKLLWILLFLLPSINLLAAIFYYFTAKKDYDRIGRAGSGGDTVFLN